MWLFLKKRLRALLPLLLFAATSQAQPGSALLNTTINATEVRRIESVLASDAMRGRKVFTPDIDKAADFIATEFKKAGLATFNGSPGYRQEFAMVKPLFVSASAELDGKAIDPKNIIVVTSRPDVTFDQSSGYTVANILAGGNLFREARSFVLGGKNALVFVDSSYAASFSRLINFKRSLFKSEATIAFILYQGKPSTYTVTAKHTITEQKLSNVVGIIPGKSRKDEYVIFSGHYDHLGTREPVNGDSIFNGANDDAAGTTAVIMLAKYFKELGGNERTLVFAAFTAEEVGGYGSQYFSRQFDPAKVMAMFNIEMIGTESKWGKNSGYITGYEKTDMGTILQKDLEGTGFTFYPDPYTKEDLFYRSDNATLARLGVPAHTISTSKMDSEPNYHQLSDQVETLDMENMAMVIKAIALSAKSIIAGTATPQRVKTEELK